LRGGYYRWPGFPGSNVVSVEAKKATKKAIQTDRKRSVWWPGMSPMLLTIYRFGIGELAREN